MVGRVKRGGARIEPHLRALVDANIIGVVVARADGPIVDANDYYLRVIGCSRDELDRGEVDWRALTPPEWLPADERAIAQLRDRGSCDPYEKEYVRRDGTRVSEPGLGTTFTIRLPDVSSLDPSPGTGPN